MGNNTNNYFLLFIASIYIAASTAQTLSVKRSGYLLPPFFILFTVSTGFSMVFACSAFYVHKTSGGFLNSSRRLSLQCLFIGLLNALNGVCVLFANPFVAGSVQALFAQANVIFTMILAWCVLGHRFVNTQWGGAGLIITGIALEFVPDLLSQATGFILGWSLLFVTGQVPSAAQSVYQEAVFRNANVNVVQMLAWSSLGQSIVLSTLLPIDMAIASFTGKGSGSLVDDLISGWWICKKSESALWVLVLYMTFMLITMTTQTLLVKHSSASLQSLIITMVTPCSSLAFSIPLFCPPPYTEPLELTTLFALIFVVVGVLLFRYGELSSPAVQKLEEMKSTRSCVLKSSATARSEIQPLLSEASEEYSFPVIPPRLMNSRSGLIASEYTADSHGPDVPIWKEFTRQSMRDDLLLRD